MTKKYLGRHAPWLRTKNANQRIAATINWTEVQPHNKQLPASSTNYSISSLVRWMISNQQRLQQLKPFL